MNIRVSKHRQIYPVISSTIEAVMGVEYEFFEVSKCAFV